MHFQQSCERLQSWWTWSWSVPQVSESVRVAAFYFKEHMELLWLVIDRQRNHGIQFRVRAKALLLSGGDHHSNSDLHAHAEFVEMVSSSANEISCKDNKTTITPEHVLQSLDQLGFLELMEGVNACWQEWKEANKSKG